MQVGPPVQVLFGSQHFRRQLFNVNLKSAFSYYCPQLAKWLRTGCALQFSGLFWFCSWLLFIKDFKQCKKMKWTWQWNHLEFGVSLRKTQLKLIFFLSDIPWVDDVLKLDPKSMSETDAMNKFYYYIAFPVQGVCR